MTKTQATVTIAISTALSGSFALGRRELVGIVMPAAWTAAGLSFQVSTDNSTFVDLHSTTAEVTATAAVSLGISLDRELFRGWKYLKVRSGTSATPVTQAAARVLTVLFETP